MARGFESKSVASQQEEEERASPRPRLTEEDAARRARRRGLELSHADVERRLAEARAEPHREMLRRALAALDEQIASLE